MALHIPVANFSRPAPGNGRRPEAAPPPGLKKVSFPQKEKAPRAPGQVLELKMRYLGFHDKLTGLYNRAYYEEELKRSDTERQLPISLIMGDVNCLKLVNDAFGHRAGDWVLVRIAQILRCSCRREDVITRWGGDEFALLFVRTGGQTALEIVERIKLACRQASQDPIPISISFGIMTKEHPAQDTQRMLKRVEEGMYRNKLLEGRSVRAQVISSLERVLLERGYQTEERRCRLQKLVEQMGRAAGLGGDDLRHLGLLASFHDIGRIALPRKTAGKAGTAEERRGLREHAEIGYRIASTSPELLSIAESILAHHERWDGRGYPRELRGDEIPLPSRILAIAEAYDGLIQGGPRRAAVHPEKALRLIQHQAGRRFDPHLMPFFLQTVQRGGGAPAGESPGNRSRPSPGSRRSAPGRAERGIGPGGEPEEKDHLTMKGGEKE